MPNIRKQVTDNPLIDQVVYECQKMISEGIVLKNEEEANKYETLQTIKLSDRYADIIEGKSKFNWFDYGLDLLDKVPHLTIRQKISMAKNNALIPDSARDYLHELAKEKFLSTYEEPNNYYRMLYGLPDVGDDGIKLTREQYQMIEVNEFDGSKYIHEMDEEEINVLKVFGVLDIIKEENPKAKYLNFLGDKKINPYVARRMENFSVLYLPASDSNEVHNRFLELLERNRVYFLKTLYSEAYKFNSVYYDNFISIMIILQSFADMITLAPEFIIRRELFDLRTIQYVFESQGCEFFPEIPLKYQKRLVKNLNRLIKYKSSDKNLVDISSLFGFDDIQLFKWYILRIPVMNEDGSYRHDTIEDPKTQEDIPDYDNNYKLKFLKVPIDGVADEHIRDKKQYKDYDSVVAQDQYWNGDHTPEWVKEQILKREFNICISKYISIDTVYSLTELSFQLCYFINMVLYNGKIDNSMVTMEIPEISSTAKFPFIDVLICLYSLMYLYNDVEDDIMYDPVQYLGVMGFNFETDMNKLQQYVYEQGFTLEELGVSDFQIPKNGILTWNQLINIYLKNKNIHDHLVKQIRNADDKKMYDIYYKLYNSLMVTKCNYDYFRKLDGKIPRRYSDYLEKKGTQLYSVIKDVRSTQKDEDRRLKITKYINDIVENVYIYLDKEEFNYIFHNIPTVSLDFIRVYMYKVMNFFKSYKVDILNTNVIYKFDDKLENWVKIIDEIFFRYNFLKTDKFNIDDFINKLNVHLRPKENIKIDEKMYMEITYWVQKIFKDHMEYWDDIVEILVTVCKSDWGNIMYDGIYSYNHTYDWNDIAKTDDHIVDTDVHFIFSESINPDDTSYIDIFNTETL